jgi:hypothetical protein
MLKQYGIRDFQTEWSADNFEGMKYTKKKEYKKTPPPKEFVCFLKCCQWELELLLAARVGLPQLPR